MSTRYTPPADAPASSLPVPADPADPALDAHGHDPADYDWYPVLRRPRADGWTPAKQRLFIETLADTASPRQAADAVGISPGSAYKLRRAAGAEGFAAAWDAAVHHAAKRLVDIALERAVDGQEEPVYGRDGYVVGHRRRYNDRLLMFLIRAHLPDRYRHAHEDARRPAEPSAGPTPPMAEAVARLAPVRPADPEAALDAAELEARLMVADACDGKAPHWHDPRPRDLDVPPDPHAAELDARFDALRGEDERCAADPPPARRGRGRGS